MPHASQHVPSRHALGIFNTVIDSLDRTHCRTSTGTIRITQISTQEVIVQARLRKRLAISLFICGPLHLGFEVVLELAPAITFLPIPIGLVVVIVRLFFRLFTSRDIWCR